jgi:hypothetical protein
MAAEVAHSLAVDLQHGDRFDNLTYVLPAGNQWRFDFANDAGLPIDERISPFVDVGANGIRIADRRDSCGEIGTPDHVVCK